MNQPKKKLFGLLIVVMWLSACSLPAGNSPAPPTAASGETGAAPTNTTSITEAPTMAPTEAATGVCANPYYPIKEGATSSYQSTASVAGTYKFTDTITDM